MTSVANRKVVLVFVTPDGDDGTDFIVASLNAEVKYLIIADKMQDTVIIARDIPPININIEYEQGTMLKYIGSTRYLYIALFNLLL